MSRKKLFPWGPVLLTAVLGTPLAAFGELSTDDRNRLTIQLRTLSAAWDQPAVDQANMILGNPAYGVSDWEQFFSAYFAANSFRDDLRNYLGYPVFFWLGQETNLKLQQALAAVLWERITQTMRGNAPNLGQVLANDRDVRETLFNCHWFYAVLAQAGIVSDSTRNTVYGNYRNHVLEYPGLFAGSATLNTNATAYVGLLRAQIQMVLVDSLPLTGARKSDIAQALALTGRHLDIWNDHTLLVIDNNGLDSAQLDFLNNLLQAVPPTLHRLRFVTVKDFLRLKEDRPLFSASWSVNLFGLRVGAGRENGFPPDAEPFFSDVFALVAVHELNHVVDTTYIEGCPAQPCGPASSPRRTRKEALLAQAGRVDLQYLRSMVGGAFFQDAPQEFYASISNQYFSSTLQTMRLAIERFRTGVNAVTYREPLNQFLFFTDVYSMGTNQAPFYTIDTRGVITKTFATVERNARGHITRLSHGTESFTFEVDAAGNVVNLGSGAIPSAAFQTFIPHTATGGGYLSRIFITNMTADTNRLTVNRVSPAGDVVETTTMTLLPAATILLADSEQQRAQNLTVQWVAIGSERPVSASILFDFDLSSAGLTLCRTAVGSLASAPMTSFTAPVRVWGSDVTVGIALANLTGTHNPIDLKLLDHNGNVVAQDSLSLVPFGQTAFNVHERPAFRNAVLNGREYIGALAITTRNPGQPIAALIVGNNRGALFSLPVAPGVAR